MTAAFSRLKAAFKAFNAPPEAGAPLTDAAAVPPQVSVAPPSPFPGRRMDPLFLGDRLLAYTHRGQRIFLLPTDQDLTMSILEYGKWEPHVEMAIARLVKPGDRVLEAGANVGYHTLSLAHYAGPEGLVHAFEANPVVMRLLRSTMFQNNYANWLGAGRVNLHQKALTDRPGMLTLQVAPDHFGSGHLITSDPNSDFGSLYSAHFEVEAVSADQYLAELPAVDFIHMDIEGAEPLAIKGAEALIDRSPRVRMLLEWSVGMMGAMASVDDLVNFLVNRGFRFWVVNTDGSGFAPVSGLGMFTLPHCDVVIAREDPN